MGRVRRKNAPGRALSEDDLFVPRVCYCEPFDGLAVGEEGRRLPGASHLPAHRTRAGRSRAGKAGRWYIMDQWSVRSCAGYLVLG